MKLLYETYGGEGYLTSFIAKSSDDLCIYVSGVDEALISVATKAAKIKNGVGRVKISELNDGIHDIRLILKDRSITLGKIQVSAGALKPYQYCDDIGRINRALLCALRRADALDTEISHLKEAVYGKKIF